MDLKEQIIAASAAMEIPLTSKGFPGLVLVGHPNVGKSVLFHALTGRYAMVSNFPGTTVEMTHADMKFGDRHYTVFDTPGVVSLPPRTEDEMVTRDALLKYKPEVMIQVADAKDLVRSLHLTLELSEYRIPMVLALNMADEAESRGIMIDAERLGRLLGIPVVKTIAVSGEGVAALRAKIAEADIPRVRPRYDSSIENIFDETAVLLGLKGRPLGILGPVSLFMKDAGTESFLEAAAGKEALDNARRYVEEKSRRLARPIELLRYEARQTVVQEIAGEVLLRKEIKKSGFAAALGLWCLRPFPGYAIALFVLYLLYEFVGVFGAGTLVGLLEENFFGGWLNPVVTEFVRAVVPWTFLQDFFVGEYGIFTMALTYALALIFPIVTTFFIFFGVLEDSGYLPRLAVMLDRFFRLIGLNGKAVLPMVLGLGCGTMSTVTTRVLDTKKEKILVSLLLTLAVPCSAQLGVIFGMSGGVSPRVLVLWFTVVMLSMMMVGWGAARIIPGGRPPLLVQIPPLRLPKASNVFKKVTSRLTWYSQEVIPLFMTATAVLFVLDKLHWLKKITSGMSPVVVGFLGLPEKAAEAFLIGFLRRDYGAAGLFDLAQQGLMDSRQVAVSMVLVTLFMPCVAHMLVTYRERGARATALIFIFVMSYALLVGAGINQLLLNFPIL